MMKSPVLIVEDVEEMRLMMVQLIDGMSRFKVSGSCSSVTEARLELTRRRPALVLLDEILPGESSTDLLAELVGEGIPVVLMTGVENADHPVAPGAKLRLMKPDWRELDQVRAEIEKLLTQAVIT